MPIQLDKILADIAREKYLHPNYPDASKADTDEAWDRVSKSNKLSVHEARSIFKVLQKKYEQEKLKGKSAWKLYSIMEEIHRKIEVKPDLKKDLKPDEDADIPLEEDEEYEMLEVQEEDEHTNFLGQPVANSTGSASDNESPTKSSCSNGTSDDRLTVRSMTYCKQAPTTNANNGNAIAANIEEKKLLNNMVTTPSQVRKAVPDSISTSSTVEALHKKGITLKKANTPISKAGVAVNTPKAAAISATNAQTKGSITARIGGQLLEVGKTIQMPESMKRKICDERAATPVLKKLNIGAVGGGAKTNQAHSNAATADNKPTSQANVLATATATHAATTTTTSQLVQIKPNEREDGSTMSTSPPHGINLITIPANPTRAEIAQTVGPNVGPTSSTAGTIASTASTNGFSPRIDEIDFRNDIIFDAGNGLNGTAANATNAAPKLLGNGSNATADIINLGNFDNSLPPTFFKNLCNSSRFEALGLYVANVMNRLSSRSAAKLELGILRAIIDVQSDELE